MRKVYEELTKAFRHNNGVLLKQEYQKIVTKYSTLFESSETIFYLLQASGYPINLDNNNNYTLETHFQSYSKQRYCIIDIETNGSKPGTSQVIEIGAVMVQDGEIIDSFETFVACTFLPEYITKITGIEPTDLINAPSRREALTALREFMGDAVFVAHNADFDYNFLTSSFNRFGLGDIGNPVLCTIELAKRTFESERYGLAYLNESLGIETATHHRAYSDAMSAWVVMQKSLENIPAYVKTTDDFLQFSKSSRKERSKRAITQT